MNNSITEQIKSEIASYEAKIKTLKSALIILGGQGAPEPTEKRRYTKTTKVVKSKKIKTKKRKTKLPIIKWKGKLVPFMKSCGKPLNVAQITDHFFPGV